MSWSGSRRLAGLLFPLAAATAAWIVYADAAWTYVPRQDSALYLEAALRLGSGRGVTTLVGYPAAADAQTPLPFFLHPPGSILPYALAALGRASDHIAIALATSLALHLITVCVLTVAAYRISANSWIAAVAGTAYALDPLTLDNATGIFTTNPHNIVITLGGVLLLGRWPPSPTRLVGAATLLAIAHFIRMNDAALFLPIAALLAWQRLWSHVIAFALPYVALVAAGTPFMPLPSHTGALLLADTRGFEGFALARLDATPLTEALRDHLPALLRKTAANFLTNIVLFPETGNAFLTVSATAVVALGALRGVPQHMVLGVAMITSLALSSAVAVSPRYLVHLFPLLYLALAIAASRWTRSRILMALVLAVAIAVFIGSTRARLIDRTMAQEASRNYLSTSQVVRALTVERDTVITDIPEVIALYAERRAFKVPLRIQDLESLEQRVGPVRVLVLTQAGISDMVGYPDPSWRALYRKQEIRGYELARALGEGPGEILIYLRR